MTLSAEEIDLVKQLDAEGYTYRQIAKKSGVSQPTIRLIIKGKHTGPKRTKEPKPTSPYVGKVARCPECGAKVFMPCVACRSKK